MDLRDKTFLDNKRILEETTGAQYIYRHTTHSTARDETTASLTCKILI
jgi:hypothetical protein